MNSQTVKFVNKVKSLGVVLTSDISWHAHVSSVSSKVHGVLHKLSTRGWLLPSSMERMLVQVLVYPHLDYAYLVFNKMPAKLRLKMQWLANVGIRFIFNLRRDTSITPYRRELGWCTFVTSRAYFLGSTAYSILTKLRSQLLHELLSTLIVDFACLHVLMRSILMFLRAEPLRTKMHFT